MAEPSACIDVLFVGHTGVGKSTLINMIRGIPDSVNGAARVSNGACPCTVQSTPYPLSLETGLSYRLWDTRGLDEAADTHDRGFKTKIREWIRHLAYQQERELKEALRGRIRLATPILVWCIDAAKVDVHFHWQQFHKVYVEYCERKAIPAVVVTRMSPRVNTTDWEARCVDQVRKLGLGDEFNAAYVPLLRVRQFRTQSGPEYDEDSKALRDLICNLTSS